MPFLPARRNVTRWRSHLTNVKRNGNAALLLLNESRCGNAASRNVVPHDMFRLSIPDREHSLIIPALPMVQQAGPLPEYHTGLRKGTKRGSYPSSWQAIPHGRLHYPCWYRPGHLSWHCYRGKQRCHQLLFNFEHSMPATVRKMLLCVCNCFKSRFDMQ